MGLFGNSRQLISHCLGRYQPFFLSADLFCFRGTKLYFFLRRRLVSSVETVVE